MEGFGREGSLDRGPRLPDLKILNEVQNSQARYTLDHVGGFSLS